MKTILASLLLLLCAVGAACAQTNAGDRPITPKPPFHVEEVTALDAPWRIAFLPDGRMLITEKPGQLLIVNANGKKTPVAGVPPVVYRNQGGLLGVYLSPTYARDRRIYLTYSEPEREGSGLALARALLRIDGAHAALEDLRVIWHDAAGGSGGQFGAAVAFSPDGKDLFLAVGDRQRMAPAQDPNSPLGKILRLTLDGKPAPGNPHAGAVGVRTLAIIRPPRDTVQARTAKSEYTYAFPSPNLTPAEIWTSGHRNPYGLAFAPDGRLWELEHGPRGGDELNLIVRGKNYGWPPVSYGVNYDGVPIASPQTRPDLAEPALYWTPVIAPGNMAFYRGDVFPQWRGDLLASGLGSETLSLIRFDARGNPTPAARWMIGFRVRDVAVAPNGAVWLLKDGADGGLYRLVPKP